MRILAELKKKEGPSSRPEAVAKAQQELDTCLGRCHYEADSGIEFRFDVLRFEQIWQLQQDGLIARDLTPPSRASNRVVLSILQRIHAGLDAP